MKALVPEGAAPEAFLKRLPPRAENPLHRRRIPDPGGGHERAEKKRAVLSSRTRFIAPEVGLLGAEIIAAGKVRIGPDDLEPLYLRRSQAEEGR